jgi:heme-degrading monooxygenase HmoA
MSLISKTPAPPYYAVIFTSEKTADHGYSEMSAHMIGLSKQQDGFLGMESAREEVGITVSYWRDLESIKKWKMNTDHLQAQQKGRADWYKNYKVRICLVERDYGFER